MANITPNVSQSERSIPFWRDGRILGVLAQIAFLVGVILAAAWLLNNVLANMDRLGAFRCADGSNSFLCGFNFLKIDAQFDIGETTLLTYDPSNPFSRALAVGALNTARVAFFGIILATLLGTVTGIARLSTNWLINSVAKWYVDLIRNTPLLLQLFFLYFGVILLLPPIRAAMQPFGLPIFMSQRGIDMPWPVLMPSGGIWLISVLLAVIVAITLWIVLGRREIILGKNERRPIWATLSFLVILIIGWFAATTAGADNQAVLAQNNLGVTQFADLERVMQQRLGVTDLADVSQLVADGTLAQAGVDTAVFTICALRDDPAEVNLAAELRRANIPYTVQRFNRANLAANAFIAGDCDLYSADKASLNAAADAGVQVAVTEAPVRISLPSLQGLNFAGGYKLTPNFAAILIGLVLYTGAFIAEIVRAGIQSVHKGQSEAARALGLSEAQRLQLVVLPQALRVIIPPLTSQYLNLVKNSSLAIAVGYPDLWSTAFITLNQSGQAVQVFIIVMASYLSFSLLISFLLNWYNRRIALVER